MSAPSSTTTSPRVMNRCVTRCGFVILVCLLLGLLSVGAWSLSWSSETETLTKNSLASSGKPTPSKPSLSSRLTEVYRGLKEKHQRLRDKHAQLRTDYEALLASSMELEQTISNLRSFLSASQESSRQLESLNEQQASQINEIPKLIRRERLVWGLGGLGVGLLGSILWGSLTGN